MCSIRAKDNVYDQVMSATGGHRRWDVILECQAIPMRFGSASRFYGWAGVRHCWEIPSKPMELNLANDIIFKARRCRALMDA